MLSREGLEADVAANGTPVEVSEDTLAVVEASDAQEDVLVEDIAAVDAANEEATEVEEAVEDIGDAVESLESIMIRISQATADRNNFV